MNDFELIKKTSINVYKFLCLNYGVMQLDDSYVGREGLIVAVVVKFTTSRDFRLIYFRFKSIDF